MRGRRPRKPIDEYPNNLRALRLARGLSQQAIADMTGMHVSQIGKLERGERALKMHQVAAFARALDARPFEILSGEQPLSEAEQQLLALMGRLTPDNQARLLKLGAALEEADAADDAVPEAADEPAQAVDEALMAACAAGVEEALAALGKRLDARRKTRLVGLVYELEAQRRESGAGPAPTAEIIRLVRAA